MLYRAVYGAAVARALLPFTAEQNASGNAAGAGEEASTYTAEVAPLCVELLLRKGFHGLVISQDDSIL